jgi:hypothetical protein
MVTDFEGRRLPEPLTRRGPRAGDKLSPRLDNPSRLRQSFHLRQSFRLREGFVATRRRTGRRPGKELHNTY